MSTMPSERLERRPMPFEDFLALPAVMVAEVISPTTRSEDTLRKSGEYFAAGIGQYWIVDPANRSLTVLRAGTDGWDIALELDADRPTREVTIGEYGTVAIDLVTLLAV